MHNGDGKIALQPEVAEDTMENLLNTAWKKLLSKLNRTKTQKRQTEDETMKEEPKVKSITELVEFLRKASNSSKS